MERRKFIQIGAIITASTLISFTIKNKIDEVDNEDSKRDDYNDFNEPILKAIAIGLHAPSAHNTQPWKFKLINNKEALLFIDENKLLLATDPLTRQIHISGGCFLEALSIGCSALGFKANIELLVDGNYTIEKIGKMPIAKISLQETKEVSKHLLWNFIFQRRMNRTNYTGELITNAEFNIIKNDCGNLNSNIHFVNEPSAMKPYAAIFKEAMAVESKTLVTNEETRRMFRFSDRAAFKHRDGITFDGNGLTGIKKMLAQAFTKNTTESWNSPSIVSKGLKKFDKTIDTAKGFVMLVTQENNFKSQIETGRDLYKLCLALTKSNMYMHPLNQANEEFVEMQNLSKNLDSLVGIANTQKIQIIARIGRGEVP
jgi:hypothetical protein